MPQDPIVSAIVVSWNTCDLLRRCLASLHRAVVPMEIVVVDNASTDGSKDMVLQEYPEVFLIANTANVGFGRANNQAFARARGEYVLLLNPDAELQDGALEHLLETMAARPDAAVVGPRVLESSGDTQSTRRRFPTLATHFIESTLLQQRLVPNHPVLHRYYVLDRPASEPQEVDWLVGACLLVRRSAIADVGGFDERFFMYFEETDWCRRFRGAGWAVVYEPGAVARHHGGQSSEQVPVRRHCEFNESKCRYVRKWHGALVALALRWYLFLTSGLQLLEESAKLLIGHRRELRRERIAFWTSVLRWQAARLLS